MAENRQKYFLGIDPGVVGGLGIVDQVGKFVAAHRWSREDPARLYNILLLIKDLVRAIYLEDVRIFPREEKGFITQNQGLLVNSGIWQGWLISLNLPYHEIAPATWQAQQGLYRWQQKQAKNPAQHSPLSLARLLWPGAPLEFQADDGKAVGLLLADLARRDALVGLDREAIRDRKVAKEKARKKALKKQVTLVWEETTDGKTAQRAGN